MKLHDLAMLICRREGKREEVNIAQCKEIVRVLRDYMANKKNKKVSQIVEFLLTPKKPKTTR